MKIGKLARKLRDRLVQLNPSRRATRDVVLISFPKSGRTWVRFMLNHAGVHIEYTHSGAGNRLGLPFEAIAGRVHEWTDRRVIFLTRDPRDTVVSCYFQATKRIAEEARFQGEISEFIRHPGYGIEKIARFNLHWLESAHLFDDFLPVSYEDLHASGDQLLARVIAFATRRDADMAKVHRAREAGRFDNMRKAELALSGSQGDKVTRLGGGLSGDAESFKTRRGKVGGWGDYLSVEDVGYVDETLARLRYWERLSSLIGARDVHG